MSENIEYFVDKFISGTLIPFVILRFILVFLVGWLVIKLLLRAEKKILEKSSLDEASYVAIVRATKIALWIVLALALISLTGVNMSPYVALIASAGAALALALKDSLSNVAGGIIILFTQPFVKGDEIQVENVSGVVDYIDIMVTKLHTFSNQDITIPNSKMVNSIIINKTKNDLVRVDLKFEVSYNSDLEKVKVLLNNIVEEGELLLTDPAPVIGISSYEDSGIVWDMMVWTHTADRFKAKYYLGDTVKAVFDKNGIEIPYPHMVVKIDGEE